MKTLAFDTSTKYLTIACLEGEEVKAEFHKDVGIGHSEILVPTFKGLLEKLDWKITGIDLVCVGIGPGSFTGLRIAVATVKGLAAVIKNKLVGVPSMDAMALNFPSSEKNIAPLLDARKGKVYSCIYDRSGEGARRITDYLLVTVEELLESLEEEVVFFGDGVDRYEDKLAGHPLVSYDKNVDWYPKASHIGRIGLKRSCYMKDDPETIEPLYLHAKECNITGDRR